jgi:hypothetical protein
MAANCKKKSQTINLLFCHTFFLYNLSNSKSKKWLPIIESLEFLQPSKLSGCSYLVLKKFDTTCHSMSISLPLTLSFTVSNRINRIVLRISSVMLVHFSCSLKEVQAKASTTTIFYTHIAALKSLKYSSCFSKVFL